MNSWAISLEKLEEFDTYDNKKNKNIYGTASTEERLELEEEGIELASIPWVKNKEN